jgi:hypothetical protein
VGHDPREAQVTAAAARWAAALAPDERQLYETGEQDTPGKRRPKAPRRLRGPRAQDADAAAAARLFCGHSIGRPPAPAALPRVCRALVELASRAGVDAGDARALRGFAARVAVMTNEELDELRRGSGGKAA